MRKGDDGTTNDGRSGHSARTGTTSAPPAPESAATTVPIDEVFALLRNQRRRNVLRYLADHEGTRPVTLSDLAEQIAAWENDKPVARIRSDERKRVYVGLYQVHLPKMDELDVIAFDKSRGTIERAENAEICYRYLDRATRMDDSRPWHRYYAGLAVIGAVSLAIAMWLQPQTNFPVTDIVTVGVIVAFCSCSAWHWWSRPRSADGPADDA